MKLHVRPTLRVVYAVAGRPTVLTRGAAYRGAVLAAVSKRCDCYTGSGAPNDYSETCAYHDAISGYGEYPIDEARRKKAAAERLASIYRAEDAKTLAGLDRPAIDLSHMREDELQEILVAIDWHLANGQHKPARKRRKRKRAALRVQADR